MNKLFICPSGYAPELPKLPYIKTYEGSSVLVDDIRSLEESSKICYVFNNAEKLNPSVIAALLKRVEEGLSTYVFCTESLVMVNKALASRCIKIFVKVSETYTEEKVFAGLNDLEKSLVRTALGLAPYKQDMLEKEGIDYSKVFRCLGIAYCHRNLFESVKEKVWLGIESVFDVPYFQGNVYSFLSFVRAYAI